jgi:hypothetical protein
MSLTTTEASPTVVLASVQGQYAVASVAEKNEYCTGLLELGKKIAMEYEIALPLIQVSKLGISENPNKVEPMPLYLITVISRKQ